MNTSRNLLIVSAALIVGLGVLCGKLWGQLRAEQRLVAELRANENVERKAVEPAPAPVALPVPAAPVAAPAAPAPLVQIPAPRIAIPLEKPGTSLSTSLPDLRVPSDATEETRHAEALRQSDQTASERVLAWSQRIALQGVTLTAPQLQALNAATRTELRRETEESLYIDNRTGPMDADAAAQLREETINRQNETNLRILDAATPQLTADVVNALRSLFEAGHAQRLATARADRERIANGGN
jgi:hypothetical protein